MEFEQLLNPNHHVAEKVAPASAPTEGGFDLAALRAKRDQLIAGLNQARAQLETQAQSVARTEGALLMVNQMILELDPDAFKEQGG